MYMPYSGKGVGDSKLGELSIAVDERGCFYCERDRMRVEIWKI